jgi:hypothetical protein
MEAHARWWRPCGARARSVGRLRRSAPVAQLDRASVYGTEGREFESLRARFLPVAWSPVFIAVYTASVLAISAVGAECLCEVGYGGCEAVEEIVGRHWRAAEESCLALDHAEDLIAVEAVEVEQQAVGV